MKKLSFIGVAGLFLVLFMALCGNQGLLAASGAKPFYRAASDTSSHYILYYFHGKFR